jgi:hypothetical protein
LSQPALFGPPQFESPVGVLIWPVQVTLGFDSDTEPEAGLAPRVIGIRTTATATTKKQSSAARAYLDRRILEIARVFASLLNIFRISFFGLDPPSIPVAIRINHLLPIN